MKSTTLACLVAVGLLAACSSENSGTSSGTGASTAGYGQQGGAGSGNGAGAGGHATPGSEEDLVQSVGDRIYFDTDQSTLNDQARGTLDQQVGWLQRYPQVRIWIAGNCDERGTEEYNLALGQRRANADREYLMAHGIAAARIQIISYGKDRPIDPGTGESAWAKDRNAITSVQ
jgi:peptidoglycan-associated lipoprotein